MVVAHLGVRLDLDEGHVVDEQGGQQRDRRRRQRQDLQEFDRVRLDEGHVDGDVRAGGQAQERLQDADDGAPAAARGERNFRSSDA